MRRQRLRRRYATRERENGLLPTRCANSGATPCRNGLKQRNNNFSDIIPKQRPDAAELEELLPFARVRGDGCNLAPVVLRELFQEINYILFAYQVKPRLARPFRKKTYLLFLRLRIEKFVRFQRRRFAYNYLVHGASLRFLQDVFDAVRYPAVGLLKFGEKLCEEFLLLCHFSLL